MVREGECMSARWGRVGNERNRSKVVHRPLNRSINMLMAVGKGGGSRGLFFRPMVFHFLGSIYSPYCFYPTSDDDCESPCDGE